MITRPRSRWEGPGRRLPSSRVGAGRPASSYRHRGCAAWPAAASSKSCASAPGGDRSAGAGMRRRCRADRRNCWSTGGRPRRARSRAPANAVVVVAEEDWPEIPGEEPAARASIPAATRATPAAATTGTAEPPEGTGWTPGQACANAVAGVTEGFVAVGLSGPGSWYRQPSTYVWPAAHGVRRRADIRVRPRIGVRVTFPIRPVVVLAAHCCSSSSASHRRGSC